MSNDFTPVAGMSYPLCGAATKEQQSEIICFSDCCPLISDCMAGSFGWDDVGWIGNVVGVKILYDTGQQFVIVVIHLSG